jgi:hypothetical protein
MATQFIDIAKMISKQKSPIELILQIMGMLKTVAGFEKITLYPIDYNVVKITTENIGREKKSLIHTVDFNDEHAGAIRRLAAIAGNENELIDEIWFQNIDKVNPNDRIILREKGTMFGLMVPQTKKNGGPSFIIQAEMPPAPPNANVESASNLTLEN